MKPEIDIKEGELVVKVDGEPILTIDQVSDNECINLYLYTHDGCDLVDSPVADKEILKDREDKRSTEEKLSEE